MVLRDLYQEELVKLRELGAEFSRDNPALAPMLGAKGDDPDVERLLEGVAFLSSLTRRTLAEGFPELIQALTRMVFPAALLPIPSATIIAFQTARGFMEPIKAPAGTALASNPVAGVSARFTTTTPMTILPAAVTEVKLEEGRTGEATVSLTIGSSAPLGRWLPNSLNIHLAGDYPEASERWRVLLRKTVAVEVEAQGQTLRLGPESVQPSGFGPGEKALPNQSLLAFNLVQEYFVMPWKLLFLRVEGLAALASDPSQKLTLKFRLANLTAPLSPAGPRNFLLNAAPAINVFPHPAHPLVVDHRRDEYPLRPQDQAAEKLEIYSVDAVTAITQTGQTKKYAPFESFFREADGFYRVIRRVSPTTSRPEHFLSLIYYQGQNMVPETLSVSLRCHNGSLIDSLRTGEICDPTDTSPAMVTFANIIPPTRAIPPLGHDWQMWRLVSHLNVNLMPELTTQGLREILGLHARPNDPDIGRALSNRKRLEAIQDLTSKREDIFVKGLPYRGSLVELTLDPAGFASAGDLVLFGETLDNFFALFHQINAYSRLKINVKGGGETLTWPPRLGLRRLV
ncbi:MAG: type VI secretion system baseplate subunit TssF [Deltaproteobacteria bacterium]|jgi:type VI secretion system protein ImpG|nr:type VI secretion system baseplate subunit TssF [Deltaproteobacteria bacterium]